MSQTYEAIYHNGHLEWLGAEPGAGRHKLLVTVVDSHPHNTAAKRSAVCSKLHVVHGDGGRVLTTLMPRLTGCVQNGIARSGRHRLNASFRQ